MSNISYTENLHLTQYEGVEMPALYDNITEDNEKIDECCGRVEEILTEHGKHILKNKQNIANNLVKITALQNENVEQNGEIATMQSHLESLDIQSETHALNIGELTERVDTAETNISDLDTRLTEAEEAIESAELPNIVALENKVNTNAKNISDIQSDVRVLQVRVDNLENDLTTLEGKVENNTTEIDELKTCCEEVKLTLENLQEQITSNDLDIERVDTEIINIKLRLDAIESDMDTLSEQVESLTDRVTALEEYQGREGLQSVRNRLDNIENTLPLKADVRNIGVGTTVTVTSSIENQMYLVCTSDGRMVIVSGDTPTTMIWSENDITPTDDGFVFTKDENIIGMILSNASFTVNVTNV